MFRLVLAVCGSLWLGLGLELGLGLGLELTLIITNRSRAIKTNQRRESQIDPTKNMVPPRKSEIISLSRSTLSSFSLQSIVFSIKTNNFKIVFSNIKYSNSIVMNKKNMHKYYEKVFLYHVSLNVRRVVR